MSMSHKNIVSLHAMEYFIYLLSERAFNESCQKKVTKTTCPLVRFSDCHNLRKLLNYVVQLPDSERKKLLNIVSHFDTNRPNQTKVSKVNHYSLQDKTLSLS